MLSKKLPLIPSSKTASKFAEWVSAAWKKVGGKTAEQSLKKCCITNVSI
jgi:hypothetical protein